MLYIIGIDCIMLYYYHIARSFVLRKYVLRKVCTLVLDWESEGVLWAILVGCCTTQEREGRGVLVEKMEKNKIRNERHE